MAKYIKTIARNLEASEKLLKGIEKVAEAVGSTLGPRSRTVAIDITPNYDVPPTIVRDGVTVARSINLLDPHEDMGARLIKNAALKTNQVAGDGTTTSTILAHAIVKEAHKAVQAGNNPMKIKAEIEETAKEVLANLESLATKVTTDKEKEQIASISASDPEIGKLVAEALTKVGSEGVITVEEGNSSEIKVDYKQGMEIDKGYLSYYFVTDHEKMESVIEDPYILLTDRPINYSYEIIPFLENFVEQTKSKNLVIFAAGAAPDDGLATLVSNKLRGNINVCLVQAPAFGGRRTDELEDIAALVGGRVLLTESGRDFKSLTVEELGRADKVISDRDKTIIINGKGKGKDQRIKDLREQIKAAPTEFDKEIKKERLAKLIGGVAVINVGATTEVEMKDKKERVIDAVNATKAAVESGIVAGGEITLLNLGSQAPVKGKELFSIGRGILLSALKVPFQVLMENSGIDYAEAVKSLSGKDYPFGIDVMDGEVKDLIKSGVIDPVLVTKSALENAVSVATMVLTTQTLITDVPSEELTK